MTAVDLVTFLRARLDEREAAARDASQANWRWYVEGKDVVTHVDDAGEWDRYMPANTRSDAAHIALNDPAFVLADVAAKRRIVGRHRRYGEVMPGVYPPWDDACDGCGFPGDPEWPATEHINDCPELRDLAAPFASHPDFDPAWAVEA